MNDEVNEEAERQFEDTSVETQEGTGGADIVVEAGKFFMAEPDDVNQVQKGVLQQILSGLGPVDFEKRSGLDNGKTVPQKVHVVVTLEEVLKVAKELRVDLCRNDDQLYSYNGTYWEVVGQAELESFLGQAAQKIGVEEITAKYHLFRNSLYKQFLAAAYLPKPRLPEGVVLINLQNGTFEITSGGRRLRGFRPADFLTYQLPFSHEENVDYPKWQKFLDRVLPDEACQKVLAEYFAYIFTTLKLEKTLMLLGPGANGKSVVFDVLTALLGEENITHFNLQALASETNRALLANKLLNYASEISTRLESDVFKKMSSGEPINARQLYHNPFIMTRYAKLAFNANVLPRDVEINEAYFRRFLIIPFDVFIPEEERNLNLAKEIIAEELTGVFNWVLGGLERLLEQGNFSPCEAASKALEEYRKESDSVALFVEEMGYHKVSLKEHASTLKSVYDHYKSFCVDNGLRALSSTNLRKRLEAMGFYCPRPSVGRMVYASRA